jgi:zinc protease
MAPVRVERVEGAPVVAVRLLLPGGARCEEIPGQALVTGRTLAEGSRRHDWRQLAELAESRGMSSAGFGGVESHGVAVDALAGDWRAAVDLAAELLFEPIFPDDRLKWIARHAAAELEAQADQADLITGRAFADALYSPHPRGRPLQGDARSLATLEPSDASGFHAEALRRGGWIVVAGRIDPDEVRPVAEAVLSELGAPVAAPPEPSPPPTPAAQRREIVTRARDQAHLFVGHLTVGRNDPSYTALEIAGVALGAGAGLSGRMPLRLRDREGLAYAVSSDLAAGAGLDAGRLHVYLGTAPGNLERAERAIREELQRLVEDGLTPEEIESARSYLLGREPFRRETARLRADLAAQGRLLGLPLEDAEWRREALLAEDRESIEAAVRRHLDPQRLTVVVGLPSP